MVSLCIDNPQSCIALVFSLLGGLKNKEQKFNATAASMNCGLLFMAVAGLMMPAGMRRSFRTQFHYWCCKRKKSTGVLLSPCMDELRTSHYHRLTPHNMYLYALPNHLRISVLKATHNFHTTTVVNASVDALTNSSVLANVTTVLPGTGSELEVSRYIAFCMLFMYLALLYFQLKTHTYLFEGQEDDDDEPPILGLWGAIVWLSIITVFIAFLSEFIVGALEVTYCQICLLPVDIICIVLASAPTTPLVSVVSWCLWSHRTR